MSAAAGDRNEVVQMQFRDTRERPRSGIDLSIGAAKNASDLIAANAHEAKQLN